MTGLDFLTVADDLLAGPTEGHWRSAVSRAYFGAFHVAQELLAACGFLVPQGDRAHGYLWLRLSNAGDNAVENAGKELKVLRQLRNSSDYDLRRLWKQSSAKTILLDAKKVIPIFQIAMSDPIKTQITDAMKTYERDVLQDVTWRP